MNSLSWLLSPVPACLLLVMFDFDLTVLSLGVGLSAPAASWTKPIATAIARLEITVNLFFIVFCIMARLSSHLKFASLREFGCDWLSIQRFAVSLGVQLRRVFLIRTLHPFSHVFESVICFVNLLHTGERLFPVAHLLVNQPQIVDDCLFHRVHGRNFSNC